MGYVITAIVALAGALAAMTLVGFVLPKEHVGQGEKLIAAPPDRLWQLIERQKEWFENVPPTEVVAEHTKKPAQLMTRISDKSLPFGGTWLFTLNPESSGTRLKIVENGEVYNPLFRFIGRFVIGNDFTIKKYLDKIAQEAAK